MRLIDADKLKEDLSWVEECAYIEGVNQDILQAIDNAPTVKTFTLADIEEQYRKGLEMGLSAWETERPKGKWGEVFHHQGWNYHKCSKCCYSIKLTEYDNFCPNCGAAMEVNDGKF